MKYRKIFVFMLMIVVMTTLYGQERYRAKPASTQLSIYSLPPLERAISCIKFYESWHGEKKHWPYVGWGHKVKIYPKANSYKNWKQETETYIRSILLSAAIEVRSYKASNAGGR